MVENGKEEEQGSSAGRAVLVPRESGAGAAEGLLRLQNADQGWRH